MAGEKTKVAYRVLLAGASGAVGQQLLPLLIESEEVGEVIAVSRRPLECRHEKLSQVTCDFAQLNELSLDKPCDYAFCSLGTTRKQAGGLGGLRLVDRDHVLAFARLAKLTGVSTFVVVSSIGASVRAYGFLKIKAEMESGLKALGFERLIIIRPSLLHGPRQDFRFGESLGYRLLNLTRPFLKGGAQAYLPVHTSQVARAMLSCAFDASPGVRVVNSRAIASFPVAEPSVGIMGRRDK